MSIKTAKIKTALILCAGFGKRLNPLTLTTPKPLLELNNVTILEKNINLIKKGKMPHKEKDGIKFLKKALKEKG